MFSKTFLIFLVALCSVSLAEEESMVTVFKDDVTKAAEKAREVGEHIAKMLGLDGLPGGQDLVNIIKDQTKTFADQAEQVQKQLEQELKQLTNSTIAESFGELNKKIQETVASFRHELETSQVTEKAAELQGKFQDGINSLVEESKKIAHNLEPQVTEAGKELEKVTKKLLDDAIENLSQLEGKIHHASGHGATAGASAAAAAAAAPTN